DAEGTTSAEGQPERKILVRGKLRTVQVVESEPYGKAGRRVLKKRQPGQPRPDYRDVPRKQLRRAAEQLDLGEVYVWVTEAEYREMVAASEQEQSRLAMAEMAFGTWFDDDGADRKSTRLNSSHVKNSCAVFCLKKKKGGRPSGTLLWRRPHGAGRRRRGGSPGAGAPGRAAVQRPGAKKRRHQRPDPHSARGHRR